MLLLDSGADTNCILRDVDCFFSSSLIFYILLCPAHLPSLLQQAPNRFFLDRMGTWCHKLLVSCHHGIMIERLQMKTVMSTEIDVHSMIKLICPVVVIKMR